VCYCRSGTPRHRRKATEQLLAGQVRAVLKGKQFSDLEIQEMRANLGLVDNSGVLISEDQQNNY